MYLMGKTYNALKTIPTAVYQIACSAAVLAIATHMATKPSELENKVVEQKVIVRPSSEGGSYGAAAVCPPVMPKYDGSFGAFDYGDFDREKNNSILIPEKLKSSALQPSQK